MLHPRRNVLAVDKHAELLAEQFEGADRRSPRRGPLSDLRLNRPSIATFSTAFSVALACCLSRSVSNSLTRSIMVCFCFRTHALCRFGLNPAVLYASEAAFPFASSCAKSSQRGLVRTGINGSPLCSGCYNIPGAHLFLAVEYPRRMIVIRLLRPAIAIPVPLAAIPFWPPRPPRVL